LRKFPLTALIAVSLFSFTLSACLKTPGGQTITPGQVVQLACGFEAPLSQVTALMNADPTLATIEQAGNYLCSIASLMKSAPRNGGTRTVVAKGVRVTLTRRF
jgi:ribosomal protein L18E